MMDSVLGVGADDAKDSTKDKLKEVLFGNVSEKAKPCINKAFDYTLLVCLLILQYMRCKPDFDEVKKIPVYECAWNNTILYSSDSPEDDGVRINKLVLAAVITGFSYGIILSIIVGVHAFFQSKNVKIHPLTASLYKCTNKIVIIDSALEIPIAFFWAPIMTSILWGFFAAASYGVYILTEHFAEQAGKDESAADVFRSSAALTLLSLFKLTGEALQYWVFYKAATIEDAESRFEKFQSTTEKVMSTFSKKKIADLDTEKAKKRVKKSMSTLSKDTKKVKKRMEKSMSTLSKDTKNVKKRMKKSMTTTKKKIANFGSDESC